MSATAEPAAPRAAERRRVRARVSGTVQGVGFRPYVFRLSSELSLGGWVCNDERGVVCEVEGTCGAVEEFLARLAAEAPPLARVEAIDVAEIRLRGQRGFSIRDSALGGEPRALVSPDTATCADCLTELWDPADRRHRYPFINCTNCGPRFTIVRGVPYDRPLTTMAGFLMCERCQAEYEDPRDRRFHAQPNACPQCGPSLTLLEPDGRRLARGETALAVAVEALRTGGIVAVKGIGGFHLACDAASEPAVARLRARKQREEKPFALMVAGIERARELVELGADEESLLRSPARPVVLAPRLPEASVAGSVAPRSPDLGVMLPYSPLHHLLLVDAGRTLVMTSGNRSDEPIAYRDEDALAQLRAIADVLLGHDRPIETRTDDSVVRVRAEGGRPLLLRRSRGFAPESLALPLAADRQLLACGAELKSTFCVAKGERAWVSHHIGELRNWETFRSFNEGIAHFERLFAVTPKLLVHDLHPDYLSSRYASDRALEDELELLAVQHHHAHLAACLAEHGERGPAVGAIFDGSGYGNDGAVWGGELLVGDLCGFERAGHLAPVPMPGGDAAVREPWRMACAWLLAADKGREPALPRVLAGRVEPRAWQLTARLARTPMAPLTTSMGRLFDAVAALCGVRAHVTYEGQAAVELEATCEPAHGVLELPLVDGEDGIVLDARPTVARVQRELEAGEPAGEVAWRFHEAVAQATAEACKWAAERNGLDTVALCGGVFQNRRLLAATSAALRRAGLRVLVPDRLPPNDGAISYGQAAVAAALMSRAGRPA